MKQLKKIAFLAVAWLIGLQFAMADGPARIAPGSEDSQDYFYVFGPGGSRSAGKDDSIQVLFFEIPVAQANNVMIYVYDPATGGKHEAHVRPLFRSAVIDTDFTIYGGVGALTGSMTARPTANQAGSVLAQNVVGKEYANDWLGFGPFNASQAEVVDGYAYFKLVVRALNGAAMNMFKVGVSPNAGRIFAFDITMHTSEPEGTTEGVTVEVPSGLKDVIEHNYDLESGGKLYLNGQSVTGSSSGKWASTQLTLTNDGAVDYLITRGSQGRAHFGLYVTDLNGKPLRIYAKTPPRRVVINRGPGIDTHLLNAQKSMPADTSVGTEFEASIVVTAKQCIGDVLIIDELPEGVVLVSTDPKPSSQDGRKLTWAFPMMEPSEQKTITLTLRADSEGTYTNCLQAFAIPLACGTTLVGQPALAIEKSGPESVLLDDSVTYTIVVSNTGTYTAKNIVVTDAIPEGLTHESGSKELTIEVGDLEPGASKEIPVTFTATKRGKVCNAATATSSNASQVSDDACTNVIKPILQIRKVGTKQQYCGKVAEYTISVHNPGDLDLTNVVVTDTPPEGTTILSANGATISENTATWTFPELKAGQEITNLKLTLTSIVKGNLCNQASVMTAENLKAETSACTEWIGHPALLLEVIDTIDPLLPGEETTYVIEVTNQGTAQDTNVKITANYPAEISPVSASGDTETTVDGKTVRAAAYPVLKPKETIRWTIKAKADQAGDSRLKTVLESDLLKTPVTEEESTYVY